MSTIKRKNGGVWEYIQLTGQDVSTLTSQLAQNIKKVNGFINISEYGAIGDGITSDQTAIANAVVDAKTKGMGLYWGAGIYLSTGNIPDLHNVRHIGDGAIKRGTNLFYVQPKSNQTNSLYCKATGGSNLNDGLSNTEGIAKISTALTYLTNYGYLLGQWNINLSAGNFTRAIVPDGLRSQNPININGSDVGGHPNVPTTVITEGDTGVSAVGLLMEYNISVNLSNVKFKGFNGTTSSAGAKAVYFSTLTTSNVHTENCYYGLSGEHQSSINVPDGIHTNDGYLSNGTGGGSAIRSLQQTNHYIGKQNAGSVVNGAIIQNCSTGFFAQELSTGHVNWITIQDCVDGVRALVNARVNADGILFKRNTRDIRYDSNSHIYVNSNTVFSTGADASGMTLVGSSGGQLTYSNGLIGEYEMAYSISDKSYTLKYLNQTVNQTTNQILHTSTLKAPHWRVSPSSVALGKKLHFKIYGSLTGTTSNKRILVRLKDTVTNTSFLAAIVFGATDTGVFNLEGDIYFYDQSKQYLFIGGGNHLGATLRRSKTLSTLPMDNDTTFTIEAYVDNATDSILVETYEISWAG
jgi:hypothetical protein